MKTTNKLSWNEIVFEFKNKDYGAFYLRKIYNKDITIATGITLLILLLLVGPPYIMAKFSKTNNISIEEDGTSVFEGFIPDEAMPPPPPPPPPPIIDPIKEIAKFIPVVVDSATTDIEILTNDQLLDTTTFKKVSDDDLVYTKPPDDIITHIDPPTFVEEMPEFPGGETAMMLFIKNNFVYPENSKIVGSEGKVYINFVIDENGKVVQVGITRSVDEYIDKEALRVIKSMPDWIPGKQNGKIVKVKLFIPINCTLTN